MFVLHVHIITRDWSCKNIKAVFSVRWDMQNLMLFQNIVQKKNFTLQLHVHRENNTRCDFNWCARWSLVHWLVWKVKKWVSKFMSYKEENMVKLSMKSIAENKGCLLCILKHSWKCCSISKAKEETSIPASTSCDTRKYHYIYISKCQRNKALPRCLCWHTVLQI